MIGENHLISIIVPVYNAETYLEAALESVQKQSYTNIEVILVDDGSTDSSAAICESFCVKDDRFRVIHQKNSGPSAARNRGVDESKGDYITFFDNDDLLHKDFVKNLYQLCVKYDCDIALTKSFAFLDEAAIPKLDEQSELLFMDNRELSMQLVDLGWTGLAVTMAKLFKRELFDNIRFNEKRIIGDDDSTIYLLFWQAKKSVLYKSPMYFYRSKRKGSITHSNYKISWLTGVEAFKERMEFYQLKGEKILYAKAMRNYCRRLAENYLMIKKYMPAEKDVLRQLKKDMQIYSKKMFWLKGNSFKQKVSAFLFAFFPEIWGKLYFEVLHMIN